MLNSNAKKCYFLTSILLMVSACSQKHIATENKASYPSLAAVAPQSPSSTSVTSCEYDAEAQKVGIYHFQFPEAQETDLVNVEGYKVHKIAAEPLQQMMNAARSQGISLKIASAFRSIKYQQGIILRKIKAGQSAQQRYFFSAPAGFSEHHTGLAIDFYPIGSGFAHSKMYQWLQKNAEKYGFVQTFTQSYSEMTGVSVESWHWKYVGSEQAKTMLVNAECYKLPKSEWKTK